MESTERPCFHCGEPIPDGIDLDVTVDGVDRPVCCAGCQAVAQLIFGAGLGRYYQFRQELGRQAGDDVEAAIGLAQKSSKKAIALDHDDPMALIAYGYTLSMSKQRERAVQVLRRAVEINPSSALAAWALSTLVDPSRSAAAAKTAPSLARL